MKQIKVLVTDGDSKNTLAIVRCLGRRRIRTSVISNKQNCLSSFSKFCEKNYNIGLPKEKHYIYKLRKLLIEKHFDVLLPVGFESCKEIIKNKKILEKYVAIPTVDYKKFIVAGRKDETAKFAERTGINIPKTIIITSERDLDKIDFFPAVLKPPEECGGVRYATNKEELIDEYFKLKETYFYQSGNIIAQEYIPGDNGYGFFGFYWKGKLISYYIHRRLHMYPRSGGPSTLACSYYNNQIYSQGKKILDTLRWHGVAMVEFKQHEKNKKFYLMEINPKYWGSLDLAIACGVEIPYYHVMYAVGKHIKPKKYITNIYFRWPDQELWYALSGKNKILELFKWFRLFFDHKVKDNILLSDLGPTIYLFKYGIKKILKR